jgi:cobalamin biosynthetic protein CobC
VAAPGTQILLPQVASLRAPGRALVLGPTYAEHVRAAGLAGHRASEVDDVAALGGGDIAVLVNPNNPDGRIVGRDTLLGLIERTGRDGSLLIVDETFMDVGPRDASVGPDVDRGNVIVLRSFGKFFGLAGLRLGFAIAAPALADRLRGTLGPWAVSGPAIAIGEAALSDTAWATAVRARIALDAARLDEVLTAAGLTVVGGTSLFRLIRTDAAMALFEHLGSEGIFVRRFSQWPQWLRFGLPAGQAQWQRLSAALAAFRSGTPHRRAK